MEQQNEECKNSHIDDEPPYFDVEVPSMITENSVANLSENQDNNNINPSSASHSAMLAILQALFPAEGWAADSNNRGQVHFHPITTGITNQVIIVTNNRSSSSEHHKHVVFRVFGHGTSKIIDRKAEMDNLKLVCRAGIGAPILARFRNGIVSAFLPGKSLSVELLRQPEIGRKVCELMARTHRLRVVGPNSVDYATVRDNCRFFTQIAKWANELGDGYDEAAEKQRHRQFDAEFGNNGIAQLRQIGKRLRTAIHAFDLPLVFSHNDLLGANIIHDPETGAIHFIDYEYAGMNFQLHDFGNLFWDYNEHMRAPSDAELGTLLRDYFHAFDGRCLVPGQRELDTLIRQVHHFEAVTHLFWCLWALMQSQVSTRPDFDYINYAAVRRRRLQRCLDEHKIPIIFGDTFLPRPIPAVECDGGNWNAGLRFVSTRGDANEGGQQQQHVSFSDVLLAGLANDGGLYVPTAYPQLSVDQIRALRGMSYEQVAIAVCRPYVAADPDITESDLAAAVHMAYGGGGQQQKKFGHPATCPLVQTGPNEFVLELFHGPTLAFKDLAMQLIAPLMGKVLERRGRRATIVCATSGDTGGAAIAAFAGLPRVDTFVLFPQGQVSPVQRRQMTVCEASNVHALAIEGTFDDCQALVKAMFNDHGFRDRVALCAVNSINWARILPQVVYYFWAALALGGPDRPLAFTVPTGNFGDIFAGYVAKRMGLPIERLVIATNENDILARTLATGRYTMEQIRHTISPSMDIQVSSNFERLLFEAGGRDASSVRRAMDSLRRCREFAVDACVLAEMRATFLAGTASQAETMDTIDAIFKQSGYLLDPHSAVGMKVALELCHHRNARIAADVPSVILATAHPAKFPDAVAKACSVHVALPGRLAHLMEDPERVHVLPNELATVQRFVLERIKNFS